MSRYSPSKARNPCFRSPAVSKICWSCTRTSYNFRSRGNFPNSSFSSARSASVKSCGLRRNFPISDRNSLRWALDNFALYAQVIFPPLPVHGLIELLCDVEAVHNSFGVGQQPPAGGVERRGHVGPVRPHLPPLGLGQLLQAPPTRRLVPPLGHGQDLRPLRVRQVGQDGDEELVPLLQAQLVDADVGDDPLGVRLLGPGVGQLVADDQPDRLRRDAQPPGDFLLVAADEQPQDLLLEAVGVAGVPPLEGRQQVLAVVAVGAAVEGGLVGPEAGLAPDVQVPDDLSGVLDLDVGIFLSTAAVAAAAVRPGPGDLEAVAVTLPLLR